VLANVAAAAPLAAAALPAFAAGNQVGKRVDLETGATADASMQFASPTVASNQAGRKGGAIPKIRVSGTWKDPAHPGCTRTITLAGNKAIINGADEDGKPWKVTGKVVDSSIFVDFTPKGGPADVEAKYKVGKGIVFPDGNVWTKA
jgi:hypothetical protein